MLRFAQVLLLALSAALAVLPLPTSLVERYYARGWYPWLQNTLTPWSNASGVSLFDVLIAAGVVALLVIWGRSVGHARRQRSIRPVLAAALTTLTAAAVLYVWFLTAWGLNYRREPLEVAIAFDATRVTPQAVRDLADRSVEALNRLYGDAHAAGFPERGDIPPGLVQGLRQVERVLGRSRPTAPSRPKRTMLGVFFEASGVDGMHAPFLLETLLNPALTPPERPAVLAHEWAHLAGYAPEDDASFVGLMAALHGDKPAQYSAWMAIMHDTTAQLPGAARQAVLAALAAGPRADRDAIVRRVQQRIEVVSRVSWGAYDGYLKSQGVREGVQSYGRVVQLLLGSRLFSAMGSGLIHEFATPTSNIAQNLRGAP